MPASKKRKPRARRSTPVAWPRLPVLEQRHYELIGLALVAAGIFFAGLIYLGWDGGEGGGGGRGGAGGGGGGGGRPRPLPRADLAGGGGGRGRELGARRAAAADRRRALPRAGGAGADRRAGRAGPD